MTTILPFFTKEIKISRSLFVMLFICAVLYIGLYWNEVIFGEEQPDELVWATNDWLGTRQVPIYYVDELICNDTPAYGCYNPNTDEIRILKSANGMWATQGCNVRDHEILHAWGYNHISMAEFNCPNPNDVSNLWGMYESDNIHHSDPLYKHVPFDSSCPRCP